MADAPDLEGVQANVEKVAGLADTMVLAFEVPTGVGVGAVDRAGSTL